MWGVEYDNGKWHDGRNPDHDGLAEDEIAEAKSINKIRNIMVKKAKSEETKRRGNNYSSDTSPSHMGGTYGDPHYLAYIDGRTDATLEMTDALWDVLLGVPGLRKQIRKWNRDNPHDKQRMGVELSEQVDTVLRKAQSFSHKERSHRDSVCTALAEWGWPS